jgi:hypothetical protein
MAEVTARLWLRVTSCARNCAANRAMFVSGG